MCISRIPDQNGISQVCYIVDIYHSGPEPLICGREGVLCDDYHVCCHEVWFQCCH